MRSRLGSEDDTEIGVRRDDDTVLLASALQDTDVAGCMAFRRTGREPHQSRRHVPCRESILVRQLIEGCGILFGKK
jgi:hypothetical protein